jgi:HSP20 family protein
MEDKMTFNFLNQNQQLPVEIKETPKDYQIVMEIPGTARDDIKLWHEGGILTITGEKKLPDTNRIWAERSGGQFTRTFQMPSDVIIEKIEANFLDGVLNVVIPKAEQTQPKAIEIK